MSFVRKQIDERHGFGAELKELRELRGWSLDQLAQATGISRSTVQALEEERLDFLRDPVYAERHVKSLIKALDGRVGFLVYKYRALLQQHNHLVQVPDGTFLARIKRSALFVPSKYFLLLMLLPLAVALSWYIWRQAADLSAAPGLEITVPAEYATLKEPTVNVRGLTDPTASVMVNGQLAIVESNGVFSAVLTIPRGMTKLTITAKRRYGSFSQIVRYITYAPE